jgi:soluble lytic murein transglycosylase-like protein
MRDPVNAMKAEVGYLDYLIAALPDKVQRSTELSQLHEFAVGAYNGGPARVSQAVAEWEQILDGSRAKRVTSLTQQSNALTATASSLKKKILAEEDPDIWKPMQKKLNATRIELAKVTNQLATLKKSTLKKETVDYILKYRFALEWFEKERAAVASVPATTVASL